LLEKSEGFGKVLLLIAEAIYRIEGVSVIGVASFPLDSIADGKFLYTLGGRKPGLLSNC